MKDYRNIQPTAQDIGANPAPYDPYSGLPLPVVGGAADILCPPGRTVDGGADWHHGNFPRRSLVKNIGGTAMRCCGMVHVPRSVHEAFHKDHRGTGGPRAIEEQKLAAVLAAGGYVPSQAVTYEAGSVRRIPLTIEQRRALIESGTIRVPHVESLRPFLYGCIFQVLSADQRREYQKLLRAHAQDPSYCQQLIHTASATAFAGTAPKFEQAYDQQLLPLARHREVGAFVCGLLTERPNNGDVNLNGIEAFRAALSAA